MCVCALVVDHCVCVFCLVVPCLNQNVMKKLEDATNNTKSWKHKVAQHEGLLRLIQPGEEMLNRPRFLKCLQEGFEGSKLSLQPAASGHGDFF